MPPYIVWPNPRCNEKEYRGDLDFPRCSGVKNGKLRPSIVKYDVIKLPIYGLRVFYYVDRIHIWKILTTLEFVFKPDSPCRKDNVKEISYCCDLPIGYIDTWVSTREL